VLSSDDDDDWAVTPASRVRVAASCAVQDNYNRNSRVGTLPKGTYDSNTVMSLCCRSDGIGPGSLAANGQTMVLFSGDQWSSCPSTYVEVIKDTEDSSNRDVVQGFCPPHTQGRRAGFGSWYNSAESCIVMRYCGATASFPYGVTPASVDGDGSAADARDPLAVLGEGVSANVDTTQPLPELPTVTEIKDAGSAAAAVEQGGDLGVAAADVSSSGGGGGASDPSKADVDSSSAATDAADAAADSEPAATETPARRRALRAGQQ
jgi:hypothetical protein